VPVRLDFENSGSAGAVFHVYDRLHLERIPHRYTVEAGKRLSGSWSAGSDGGYDLWVLGPNGFHRLFSGTLGDGRSRHEVGVAYDRGATALRVSLRHGGAATCTFVLSPNAYGDGAPTSHEVAAGSGAVVLLPVAASQGWYDFSTTVDSDPAFGRRFAGRLETGAASISDPAMHGTAVGEQARRR
jgi:phospholipase C